MLKNRYGVEIIKETKVWTQSNWQWKLKKRRSYEAVSIKRKLSIIVPNLINSNSYARNCATHNTSYWNVYLLALVINSCIINFFSVWVNDWDPGWAWRGFTDPHFFFFLFLFFLLPPPSFVAAAADASEAAVLAASASEASFSAASLASMT